MKEAQDFRAGNIYKVGNDLLLITKAEYNKGNRGASSMKLKTKNLTTGSVAETVYRASDKLEEVRLDRKNMQYLFNDGEMYTFMDQESYEQTELSKEYLGDNINFLKDEMVIDVLFYGEKPISVELPTSVDLKITYTEPTVPGNTTGRVMKAATLETGFETQVPLFCNEGDLIRVDTRSGEYLERAK
ncbi:MAG: elongation factor P [Candidatus Delongbacteria bacterium]|nr:elongation factor P [Candidatus Delongbacteria bacterium]MBN2834005.1 elongation factor P [Candidatus Delongbacteria bacterium]